MNVRLRIESEEMVLLKRVYRYRVQVSEGQSNAWADLGVLSMRRAERALRPFLHPTDASLMLEWARENFNLGRSNWVYPHSG